MFKTLFTTSALMLAGVAAIAAIAAPAAKPIPAKAVKTTALVCPVTGETIASVKDAVGSSTYKGKTYYFCCSMCKPQFDKNPAKYIKKMAGVAKATGAHKS